MKRWFFCSRCRKRKQTTSGDILIGDFGRDLGSDFGKDFSESKGVISALDKLLTIEINVCRDCKKEIMQVLGLSSLKKTVKVKQA